MDTDVKDTQVMVLTNALELFSCARGDCAISFNFMRHTPRSGRTCSGQKAIRYQDGISRSE